MTGRVLHHAEERYGAVRTDGVRAWLDKIPMLSSASVIAFVPARDLAKARAFYEKTLELRVLAEDEFALSLDANGTMIRVARVAAFIPASFTVLGWHVRDIRGIAGRLQDRGLAFVRYAGMTQDDLGLWSAPSGARVGWFKDPDDNVLSISEY